MERGCPKKTIERQDIGYTQNNNLYNRYDCLETKCYQMISPGNSILSVILELLIQPLDTAFGEIHDKTDHFNKIFVQKIYPQFSS